jgi:hypothetical protein
MSSIFGFKNTTFVKNNLILNRITSISLVDTTVQSRLFSYKTAIEAWSDKPFFGWGLGNYKPAFLHHFIPDIFNNNSDDVTFDKTHNMLLEILVTTGIVGLLVYLYFFYIIFCSLREKIRGNEMNPTIGMILGFGFLGYCISNLFLFDVFESLFMATIFIAIFTPHKKLKLDKSGYILPHQSQLITNAFCALLFISMIFIIYIGIFLPYKTGHAFSQAKKFLVNENTENSFFCLQTGVTRETLSSRDGISDFLKLYIVYKKD